MPIRGGTADKFGNRYEALWAIDQLVQIIDGALISLILEPLNQDESRGIEFSTTTIDGITNYWSIKRQVTKAAGWTLRLLAEADARGRSILGDLLAHVTRSVNNHAIFASTLGAHQFEELRAYANNLAMFETRLAQSDELKANFQQFLLPLFAGSVDNARSFLTRVQMRAIDESQLRERVSFAIRKLFYQTDGSHLDVIAVQAYLGDLLLEKIHCPIDREVIMTMLGAHGIALRDWNRDITIRDRVDTLFKTYTAPLTSGMINGIFLPVTGAEFILGAEGIPAKRKTLVVGGAGSGKSTVLAEIVRRLRAANVPVLAIRFDQLPEGVLTTTELGHKLSFPETPTLVLAGIADGAPSVLVIDQLDAVSLASGRRTDLWSVFEQLRAEVERFPQMSLIVGCREFDLEHDRRMRAMKADTSGFSIIELKPLSLEQVDRVLRDTGTEPTALQPALKVILTVPLHLSMFCMLPTIARSSLSNRDDLFDNFWTDSERRTEQRLGRHAMWTQVVDKLVDWLSQNQQLSAPNYVLDDFHVTATAMASEHVLIYADDRYRFFHESFFDYAFARRFANKGGELSDLLLNDEQHLFRRAQVRQILAYLRPHDWPRYLKQLERVLTDPKVRFHVRGLVFKWLSALEDPRGEEWAVLQRTFGLKPDIWPHVRSVVTSGSRWFGVLDAASFFDSAFSSGDPTREEEAVWMLAIPQTVEAHSERITELLRKYRTTNERWDMYLRHTCRFGQVYHSRQMFDFFLSLIDDGTLDSFRPQVAANDSWWSVLYGMANEHPNLACEAIGHWFDRIVSRWREDQSMTAPPAGSTESAAPRLRTYLNKMGHGVHGLEIVGKAALDYARQLFPRVALVVKETAKECSDRLLNDPIWSWRSFGDKAFEVHDGILSVLAKSLESLAQTAPRELDAIVAPYCNEPHDTLAYLLLRAWTNAPKTYADRLATYLASDVRRLKIGYATWDVSGSAEIHVSSQAVKAASSECDPKRFAALEEAILSMKDKWEAKHPQLNGRRQLELLESLASSRLSRSGRARLEELRRKFPARRNDPPQMIRAAKVGSPISDSAQDKMSDDNWLQAMRKHSEGHHRGREARLFGGHELSISLQTRTNADPARFAALAGRMSDDLPANYFDAILRGVADWVPDEKKPNTCFISVDQAASLVSRAHSLPGQPCGRAIAWLVEKWKKCDWPDHVLNAVTWYALNDPDPSAESWKPDPGVGQEYYGMDPYTVGINSVRGAAAGAIARILFDYPTRFSQLEKAVESLSHDRSVAVRSCAIVALLALLNINTEKAVCWFKECAAPNPVILNTPTIERFIYFGGYRDYSAVAPVIKEMLSSDMSGAVEAGARVLSVLGLSVEGAARDAEQLNVGTEVIRKAAAYVYARNVAHKDVGSESRLRVKSFFADQDVSVRVEAASAFQEVHALSTSDQAELLSAFVDSNPSAEALATVVRALEDSPVQLPDLVCKLVQLCVAAYRSRGGDMSTTGPIIATDVSKVIVRLYAQTEDPGIQSKCLDLIDEMEKHHFVGLSDELRKMDR